MNKVVIYKNVRENDDLRESFNELTRKTFCFDFVDWYNRGCWSYQYEPHVITDEKGKVISNVSINHMTFGVDGKLLKLLQIGTVMTDEAYRNKGLNRLIMEDIIEEYKDKVDGIYLFGNDSAKNYYPKYGFKVAQEYEYYRACDDAACSESDSEAYVLEKVNYSDSAEVDKFYENIDMQNKDQDNNHNDGFMMVDNLGLYQFWMPGEYCNDLYYIQEEDVYAVARKEGDKVVIYQTIGEKKIDVERLARSIDKATAEVVLAYTPVDKENYKVRIHKADDCTLYVMGEKLRKVMDSKVMFPAISHA